MKKKYNPFKMWGSYVGAVIVGILAMFNNGRINGVICNLQSAKEICSPFFNDVGALMTFIPIGFLIGYGIHYLIRKYK